MPRLLLAPLCVCFHVKYQSQLSGCSQDGVGEWGAYLAMPTDSTGSTVLTRRHPLCATQRVEDDSARVKSPWSLAEVSEMSRQQENHPFFSQQTSLESNMPGTVSAVSFKCNWLVIFSFKLHVVEGSERL